VTSAGKPLSDVRVFLSGDSSKDTTTGPDGKFSFLGIPGSSFVITPVLQNFVFTPPSYTVGAVSRSDLDFTASAESGGSLVGTTAPNFAGVDQNGQPVNLYSFTGKVIFLDICADWCAPCRIEATKLEALYQSYKDQGLQVITVLTQGSAAAWAAQFKQTFPVIEDKTGAISAPYQTGWIPINVIIDRNMVIRFHQSIDYDEALFTAIIKTYL
jgi:peroxiredoxin